MFSSDKYIYIYFLYLIFWVEDPGNVSVSPFGVQPLPTEEDGGDAVGRVGDFHAVQQPARVHARVVVLHPDLLQLAHVQHFQQEPVGAPTLEEVAKLLPQLAAARVPVGAVDGDGNVGVCARPLLVARDDDDLVLDGHQTAGFAGEALQGLCALKGQEVVSLVGQGDAGVAAEDVPGGGGNENPTELEQDQSAGSLLVSQLLLGDDHLLHVPENLPLHFLAVFGGVAQANTSYVPQVLEGELEFINAAPKKNKQKKPWIY